MFSRIFSSVTRGNYSPSPTELLFSAKKKKKTGLRLVRRADSPPDGQRDGQPYGYGVERLREVGVEQHEQRPVVREPFGPRIVGRPEVHVIGERHVLDHDQEVGHGQPGQYGVGRRHHLLAREHRDVQHVGHGAERAHQQAGVTVVVQVHVVHADQQVTAERAVRAATAAAAAARSPVLAALHARRRIVSPAGQKPYCCRRVFAENGDRPFGHVGHGGTLETIRGSPLALCRDNEKIICGQFG